jgi:hypothetical protein
VNNNASSSAAKAKKGRECHFFGGDTFELCRYAPSSKKYTRVLSPRI